MRKTVPPSIQGVDTFHEFAAHQPKTVQKEP